MQNAWEIKKPHNRVGIICAVYVNNTIIFSLKSQDIISQPAIFQDFYTVISSPYTNKYRVPRRKTSAPFSFIPINSASSP